MISDRKLFDRAIAYVTAEREAIRTTVLLIKGDNDV